MATSSKAKQLRQPDYDISTDEEGMVSDSVASSSNIFASSVESSEPSTTGYGLNLNKVKFENL
jgi:hypothetical protein